MNNGIYVNLIQLSECLKTAEAGAKIIWPIIFMVSIFALLFIAFPRSKDRYCDKCSSPDPNIKGCAKSKLGGSRIEKFFEKLYSCITTCAFAFGLIYVVLTLIAYYYVLCSGTGISIQKISHDIFSLLTQLLIALLAFFGAISLVALEIIYSSQKSKGEKGHDGSRVYEPTLRFILYTSAIIFVNLVFLILTATILPARYAVLLVSLAMLLTGHSIVLVIRNLQDRFG